MAYVVILFIVAVVIAYKVGWSRGHTAHIADLDALMHRLIRQNGGIDE